ncbi:hypothetical protein GCM10011574_38320 [Microbispora bryophytorum]|uniref:Uncharacterized protein n=1 Tax=Microbispora bryophytorum TaxID=1460882 RepID=A0A8H9H0L6_9ACTN|nr:hypothetical protein GCM10011574_38320 [Microbispora bryophytorum]
MHGRAEDQCQAEADEDHRTGVPVAEQGGEQVGEADGDEERGQLPDLPSPGPDAVVPVRREPVIWVSVVRKPVVRKLVVRKPVIRKLVVRMPVVRKPVMRAGRRVPAPVGGISRFAHIPGV